MPRVVVEDNSRMSLRIRPTDKVTIMRASALARSDMTEFVVKAAVEAAKDLIRKAEQIELSERDSLKVLDLLENPPAPNARLLAGAQALPPRA